jgi:CheY-like chemotaxis protein
LLAASEPEADELGRKLSELLHEFTRPTADSASKQASPVAAEQAAPVKPVIAVADDDPTTCAIRKLSLEAVGFDCRAADDGVLVCSIARKSLPDAIVLDVNMPRMDGFQVLYCLRSMWSTRNIPVLLLTARHDQNDIARAASNSGPRHT